ncbi:MAG: hypothetical protein U0529_07720 [Thermoanaerobaculia bacterium]
MIAAVARTSGGVSFGRGGDPDDWRPASVGLPLAAGDRLYTSRGGHAELRAEAFEIHLASATGLEAIDVSDEAKRFYVWGGSASFLLRQLRPGETFTFETPNATERFDRAGEYRIDADGNEEKLAVAHCGSAGKARGADPRVPFRSGF